MFHSNIFEIALFFIHNGSRRISFCSEQIGRSHDSSKELKTVPGTPNLKGRWNVINSLPAASYHRLPDSMEVEGQLLKTSEDMYDFSKQNFIASSWHSWHPFFFKFEGSCGAACTRGGWDANFFSASVAPLECRRLVFMCLSFSFKEEYRKIII